MTGDQPKRPAYRSPLAEFELTDAWFERLGLHPSLLQEVGALAAMAAMIEERVEHVVWKVEGHAPAGQRHWTDGKPISELIHRLKQLGEQSPDRSLGSLLVLWCEAAEPAFKCRNNLFHGVASGLGGEWVAFMANRAAKGEQRRRKFGEFIATDHTMSLMRLAFSGLLRAIVLIEAKDFAAVDPELIRKMERGLREARSIAWELENLATAVNHEKY
ncbi:MAG: hypothetical protein ACRYFE_05490 [Janthinobacterium lividum]